MKGNGLEGKTALVTGAAGGIGTEIAKLLDAHGVNLVLCDINPPGLRRTERQLSRHALLVKCDITRRADVKRAAGQAVKRFGRVDILVNNAGIIVPSLFEKSAPADIDRQVQVNLMGPLNVSREIIPHMIANGGGQIVTIASLAGIVPETFSSVYAATKFGLRGFGLTLRLELARHGIGVSTVFPDSTDTAMLRYEAGHGGSPLTFLGTAQDPALVAEAVLKAIVKNRAEVHVPAATGFFSKIIMIWPGLVMRLWPVLERSAVKKKIAYQEKYNIRERKGDLS